MAITDCARKDDFIQFLRILYTEECDLTWENVFEILYFSKKYLVSSFTKHCARFLLQQIQLDKVLPILQQAYTFDELELKDRCLQYLCPNISEFAVTEAFIDVEHHVLTLIIKQDQLKISEVDLFKAVEKWCEDQVDKRGLPNNPEAKREVLGDALYLVRFPIMSATEFATNCAYSGLLTAEECKDIFSFIACNNSNSSSSRPPSTLRFPTTPRASRKSHPFVTGGDPKAKSILNPKAPKYSPTYTDDEEKWTCDICGRYVQGNVTSCTFCLRN